MDFLHELDGFFRRIQIDVESRRRADRALNVYNVLSVPKPSKSILAVDKVYFYAKNNATEHRTVRYELVHRQPETAILRRGQPFTFIIRFADGKSFNPGKDILRLQFNLGPSPSIIKHTQGILNVQGDEEELTKESDQWDIRVVGKDADTITLQVQIPVDAPIGIWKLRIFTGATDEPAERLRLYDCPNDIYILFNPWCEDDSVYMESEENGRSKASKLLDEYVLADVGKIWMGAYGTARGREWVFGQYDDATLPVCMFLLEGCGLPHFERANPVVVSRALTKMVNQADGDNGILVGRWDGKYDDGTAPAAWTGSVKIIEDYLTTRRPVKYGQCWVFAGVLTTVCRALGIPARPVSNLVSAHDTNGTFTIDRFFDAKGNALESDPFNPGGETDSIWNFHVWVEAWMARPDLPKGYGGWQAIDATPQERSAGFYQCGPASVEAIRKGQVGLAYDVAFVLASVNADCVNWKEDKTSEIGYVQASCDRYKVGKQILTKKPFVFDTVGQSDTDDITDTYKSSEGSNEERISLLTAVGSSVRAKRFFRYPEKSAEDVIFDLIELERIPIGESFNVIVTLENRSKQVRTINAVLSATTNFYNGVKAHLVRHATATYILQPMAREELKLPVTSRDYMSKLVEYGIMKLCASATVKETNQTWIEEDDFQVIMPSVDIKVVGSKKVGQPLEVTFTFVNVLKMKLTQCKIAFEGPGLTRSDFRDYPDLAPGETLTIKINLIPKFAGEHSLIACFDSKEFTEITGSVKVVTSK
uniref:protein-glutamine gamma-glutamyltransferase n=1 Tax=Daphnia galeata TaxID=27404 RepID=A0A8J2SA07_9CRUS|nr:unnamed protein product [Daphnia galeata]